MISLIFLVMEVGICYNKWEKIFYTNGGCIIMSEENFNTENGTNEQTYSQPQQTYSQPQQQAYGSFDQTQYGYNQPASSGKGMAIASMVLGIISIPAICFWIVGLPCAIVGLILGILYNKKNEHSPMATAGIVCSIITIALLVLVLILCIVGAVSLSSLEYSYYY